MKSKAQASSQFAWIFILVAGAIILIFFINIVYKQKEISDTKLSEQILSSLETIITGAELSTGTDQPIDMPETEVRFRCEEGEFSTISLKRAQPKQIPSQIIFSPDIITGKKIIALALPWKTPFKVTNFLYLSAPNIKYVFPPPSNDQAYQTIINEWRPNFVRQELSNPLNTKPEGYEKIKLIFFGNPSPDLDGMLLSKDLQKADLTAIRIENKNIFFYKREGNYLVLDH